MVKKYKYSNSHKDSVMEHLYLAIFIRIISNWISLERQNVIINFIFRLIALIYLLINSCEKFILRIYYQHLETKIKKYSILYRRSNSNNSALCRIFIFRSVSIAIGHRSLYTLKIIIFFIKIINFID